MWERAWIASENAAKQSSPMTRCEPVIERRLHVAVRDIVDRHIRPRRRTRAAVCSCRLRASQSPLEALPVLVDP